MTIQFAFIIRFEAIAVMAGLMIASFILWRRGLTLSATTLFGVVVGSVLAVALPDLIGAREAFERNQCIANLKQIQTATEVWAKEHHKENEDIPGSADLFGPQRYIPHKPVCPKGGTYWLGTVNTPPTCSLAVDGHRLESSSRIRRLIDSVKANVPISFPTREVISCSACIANLKQLEGAKHTWALENQKEPTDVPTDAELFGPHQYILKKLVCPGGGTYRLGAVNQPPTCSLGGAQHSLP